MLSLYRRHRPKTFDEVVGQEHIVRTLRNAIELDKVHHAYLFVGSRGTGKTSMAKLLACALNASGGPTHGVRPGGSDRQGDSRGHVARCGRDGRRLEQLRGRHPRAARERCPGADAGRAPHLHPRRGAHAVGLGVERLPEDARGAAPARRLRARHHRGSQGARHDRRPLPPLRLPASLARADRRRAAARGGRGADRAARARRRDAGALRHRQLPRRAGDARAAGHLRRPAGAARRRTGHPRRGRCRARARHHRRARRSRSARCAARGAAAVELGP